ncbi:hypothetical protein A6279_00945 [Bacillus wiedmannii]|uniref:hypothetical protein n=1 Tax=Bacillus TaxID=1386 RepID=UPI0007DB060B|nr:hypothetical protein [Bacillus wiedmannii]OAK10924.1 hypothetical protein A6278_04095 [Bacillus wiedmannii]OAK11443.1 hypothetical protein A6279_00945 [Bacillus wiedmannii]
MALGFIEKAKEFILSKSKQKQAFFDREHELKTNITELEAKRSGIIEAYDPVKGLDQAAIDKIDAEIAGIQKEIAILSIGITKVSNYELEDLITHVTDAKKEAEEIIAGKVAEEEKVREKILTAKKALLKAQAEHYSLTRQADDYAADINDTLRELTNSVSLEVSRLRSKAHDLSLEIYRLASDGSVSLNAPRSDQSMIDHVQEEYDKVRSEINRLEALMGKVSAPISQLNSYTDGNSRPIYLVDRNEQIDATQKGIVKE